MRKPAWLFVMSVLAFPFPSLANDLCVIWRCNFGHNNNLDVQAFDVKSAQESAEKQYTWSYPMAEGAKARSCTCLTKIHFVQASEISSAVSSEIKAAIIEGTRVATAEALAKIQQDNARREEEMYKRLAEVVQKTDAQIKLLTELLRASTEAQTKEPSGEAQPVRQQQATPSKN